MSFSIQWAQISSHIQGCLLNPFLIFISWHAILHKLQEPTYPNKHPIPHQYRPGYIFFTSVVDCTDMAAQKFLEISKLILAVRTLGEANFHLKSKSQIRPVSIILWKPDSGSKEWTVFFFSNKIAARKWTSQKCPEWEINNKKLLRAKPNLFSSTLIIFNIAQRPRSRPIAAQEQTK